MKTSTEYVISFIMIPTEIIDNMEVDAYMLTTVVALYRFRNNENNTCFPSYKALAKYARCSERHVIRMVKKLEEKKIIKVCRREIDGKSAHASNVYILPSFEASREQQGDINEKQAIQAHEQDEVTQKVEIEEETTINQFNSQEIVFVKEEKAEKYIENTGKVEAKTDPVCQSHPHDCQSYPYDTQSHPHDCQSPELYLSNNTKSNKTNLNKKNIYGMNKNVLFSQEEYEQLKQEFPTDYQERIDRLSNYMSAMGKVYPNHLSTIRLWEDRARQKNKEALSPPTPNNSKSFAYAGTAIPDYSECKGATL